MFSLYHAAPCLYCITGRSRTTRTICGMVALNDDKEAMDAGAFDDNRGAFSRSFCWLGFYVGGARRQYAGRQIPISPRSRPNPITTRIAGRAIRGGIGMCPIAEPPAIRAMPIITCRKSRPTSSISLAPFCRSRLLATIYVTSLCSATGNGYRLAAYVAVEYACLPPSLSGPNPDRTATIAFAISPAMPHPNG